LERLLFSLERPGQSFEVGSGNAPLPKDRGRVAIRATSALRSSEREDKMLRRTVLGLVLTATPLIAHGAPRGEAKLDLGGKAVTIDYGRPSLNGRDMLAKAEIGKPWRLGADAPTTLKTDVDLGFGSPKVPHGDYILSATKVAEDKWVLNVKKPGKEESTVADVPLTLSKLPESVEVLTLELKGDKMGGSLAIKWGTTALTASFTIP
jgi:hypothetical protein